MRHLSLYVETELYQHVQKAATVARVKIAPWVRSMVHHVAIADFPASWQEARPAERSHESLVYSTRFMLRLNKTLQTKLQDLTERFAVSKADIIRQLITQANHEDFPPSWQMKAAEHRTRQNRR